MNENKPNIINWYPGHMAKARREIKEKLTLIDIVYEVLDARMPISSKIIDLDELIKDKKRIIVVTKYDLCDREKTNKYLEEYTHKIGNLTITGYNSSLGNKSFIEKRERKNKEGHYIGYKNGLEINREIATKDIWTIEDIRNRTSNLIEELMEIYKFPNE